VVDASPAPSVCVVEASSAALVDSNAHAKSVCDRPRNLDDDQLDALASSGGIIGLSFYPSFVGPQPVTLERVLDHADYLMQRVGVDSVVIGGDFIDYAVEEILGDLRGHSELYPEGSFR